ncbi:MAG: 3-hydroxybutyryl-CoA dehydrogenase [Candidatus Palauibacterales bacterium]|nr:3-hydroxybutyryl-CoA dehydrogenase [Candidatus Palauibacterales bacterium]MDP2584033.1 3-hydroxybutyryl-CoA dehydrogenase [Candidatus Palauibacterales bacterium]
MASIEKVGVLGCGLMGSGIAQVSAQAGFDTVVREIDQDALDRGLAAIRKSLDRAVKKERMTGDQRDEVLGRVHGTVDFGPLGDRDIVVEAVVEDLSVKEQVFGKLDELCGADTIFASNTSSLTITEMASVTERPDRFVGLHFFNPVPVMALVEVVRTGFTSDETFEAAWAFAKSVGKQPIACRDNSGFIVNRLLVPYMLDAIRAYEEGIGSIEGIDQGMRLGCGYPMGPFILGDFVGLDTLYKITEIMFDEYREKRFAPPPLLKRMVLAGHHGRKTGIGFYDYGGDEPVVSDFVKR